ncbi:MAG: arsenate reductase ArsC [Candidatus Bathyarchaeota archaeon]|nr:arsenate reductase ArsC [Candidatus Bathyarchaeota archaeon]
MPVSPKKVNLLFICVENAGRSQMAEAFANYHGVGVVVAQSGGFKLPPKVNSVAVAAMKEKGIDMSQAKPKLVTAEMAKNADVVVTMGCGVAELCPGPIFSASVDWGLEDPKNQPLEKVREIRDEIEKRVKQLISNYTR